MPFGPFYTIIRSTAQYTTSSYFREIVVLNPEEVPAKGPIIVCGNHHSGAVDHKVHYWAKSTLFKSALLGFILRDAGNIPVDRTTGDNAKLFAETFDALKMGECCAIFPEGTSYTMPGITAFKDGASWAALEYAKNIRTKGRELSTGGEVKTEPKDVVICIAGISYTDKSKYRSSCAIQMGKTILVEPYVEEFLVDPKAAVKKLTKAILDELTKVTVNAPDWDTSNAATMARRILWVDESTLPVRRFRDVSQTLVDIFTSENPSTELSSLKSVLLAYKLSLTTTKQSHYTLTSFSLPAMLDPSIPHPLPTRFKALKTLFVSTLSSLIRLPFFIIPLVVHLPIYLAARRSMKISKKTEDISQNKIMFGLLLAFIVYPAVAVMTWFTIPEHPFGFVAAAASTIVFVIYHNSIIDNNYKAAKRLIASYRILIGIWSPVLIPAVITEIITETPLDPVPIEHEIRKVLRLRSECITKLNSYLQMLESQEESGSQGVAFLRECGAELVVGHAKIE